MKKKILIVCAALIVLMLLAGSLFTVRENEYACTVRFSKIVSTSRCPSWTA